MVAPFDGVVTQRNIDVGSLVQADATTGTFMFTMMQTNVIRTQVYVPQDQAFGVDARRRGDGARAGDAGARFPGKVTRIADALEPNTRTLLTEIDVPNPDGALTPGIYCASSCIFRASPLARSFRPTRSCSMPTACGWPCSRAAWRISAKLR